MKLNPEYYVNYTEADICVMRRLPDGGEEEVCPISATAALVWDGLEHGLDREALIESVVYEFSADPDVVAADLEDLLAQLVELGFLVISD